MKKKAQVPTWFFSILIIMTLIFIMSLFFGETIILNSTELSDMYSTQPTITDSLSLFVKIASFQITDIVPLWITLLYDTMLLIMIFSMIFILRGVG